MERNEEVKVKPLPSVGSGNIGQSEAAHHSFSQPEHPRLGKLALCDLYVDLPAW